MWDSFGGVEIGDQFEEEKFKEICRLIDEGKYVDFTLEDTLRTQFLKAIAPYCEKLKKHYGDRLNELVPFLEAGVIVNMRREGRKSKC